MTRKEKFEAYKNGTIIPERALPRLALEKKMNDYHKVARAAPDLLQALIDLTNFCKSGVTFPNKKNELLEKADLAINKALGG